MIPLGGDHLDDIAGFELVFKGDHATVHLGAHALMADFRMDFIGKINGRGAFGEGLDLSPGGKNIDLIRKKIHPDVF